MTTSPALITHYLAESDPRQHAFPHSPNTSDEEMEEKEHVNQALHLTSTSEQCLFMLPDALVTITRKEIAPLPILFQVTPTLVGAWARRRMR
jgi:hypothetical protein